MIIISTKKFGNLKSNEKDLQMMKKETDCVIMIVVVSRRSDATPLNRKYLMNKDHFQLMT